MVRASCFVFFVAIGSMAFAESPPLVEPFLISGKLADGERALVAQLDRHPLDDQARFGLGTLRFVRAVERLAQSLHRYGAIGGESQLVRQLPFLRLKVPPNPSPMEVTYEDVRSMVMTLLTDLTAVEKTLAPIKDPNVHLPLHFGKIVLDLNDDGKAAEEERLWRLYTELNRGLQLSPEFPQATGEGFVINFDYGDVFWLRGYCHLLSGLCEVMLAYDEQSLFTVVAHHVFAKPKVPSLANAIALDDNDNWEREIADLVAGIHLSSFPLKEADRMKKARTHFKEVIRLSRESWKAIEAEADDDFEWVPNSKQTGVIPGVRVSKEMIAGWMLFLEQAEKVLDGEQLIPHWRFKPDYGVNIRRVFDEPQSFDLVLWFHGVGAAPFSERGAVADYETWRRLEDLFRGQFIGFAFWFN